MTVRIGDREERILRLWYTIECLEASDAGKAAESARFRRRVPIGEDGMLPWIDRSLRPHYGLEAGKEFTYTIFFGLFSSAASNAVIKQIFPGKDERPDSGPPVDTCYGSVDVDDAGTVRPDTLKLSTLPFALSYVRTQVRSAQSNIEGLDEAFEAYRQRMSDELNTRAQALRSSQRGFGVEHIRELQRLAAATCENVVEPGDLLRSARPALKHQRDNDADEILGSFFLRDLRRVRSSGQLNASVARYLSDTGPERLDVLDPTEARKLTQPRHLATGRWLQDVTKNQSLMQQVALNLAADLKGKSGIFSVNGPPGTGKTTMLRDLVAGIVVDRANAMTAFLDPNNAFRAIGVAESSGYRYSIYQPASAITGYEILIASSNNAAVENVSKELPLLNTIAKKSFGTRSTSHGRPLRSPPARTVHRV